MKSGIAVSAVTGILLAIAFTAAWGSGAITGYGNLQCVAIPPAAPLPCGGNCTAGWDTTLGCCIVTNCPVATPGVYTSICQLPPGGGVNACRISTPPTTVFPCTGCFGAACNIVTNGSPTVGCVISTANCGATPCLSIAPNTPATTTVCF